MLSSQQHQDAPADSDPHAGPTLESIDEIGHSKSGRLAAIVRQRVEAAKQSEDKISHFIRDMKGLMVAATKETTQFPLSDLSKEAVVRLTPEELAQLYDAQQEKINALISLFNTGINAADEVLASYSEVVLKNVVQSAPVSPRFQFAKQKVLDLEQLEHEAAKKAAKDKAELDAKFENLTTFAQTEGLTGFILLVDDSRTILKTVLKQITLLLYPPPSQIPPMSENLSTSSGDNWSTTGLITEIRGNWGVICAGNGRIALEVVKRCAVSIALTDQEMPTMSGIEFIRGVRDIERLESRAAMDITLQTTLSFVQLTATVSDWCSLNANYWTKPASQQQLHTLFDVYFTPQQVDHGVDDPLGHVDIDPDETMENPMAKTY